MPIVTDKFVACYYMMEQKLSRRKQIDFRTIINDSGLDLYTIKTKIEQDRHKPHLDAMSYYMATSRLMQSVKPEYRQLLETFYIASLDYSDQATRDMERLNKKHKWRKSHHNRPAYKSPKQIQKHKMDMRLRKLKRKARSTVGQ